jgi:hypothetical protein
MKPRFWPLYKGWDICKMSVFCKAKIHVHFKATNTDSTRCHSNQSFFRRRYQHLQIGITISENLLNQTHCIIALRKYSRVPLTAQLCRILKSTMQNVRPWPAISFVFLVNLIRSSDPWLYTFLNPSNPVKMLGISKNLKHSVFAENRGQCSQLTINLPKLNNVAEMPEFLA